MQSPEKPGLKTFTLNGKVYAPAPGDVWITEAINHQVGNMPDMLWLIVLSYSPFTYVWRPYNADKEFDIGTYENDGRSAFRVVSDLLDSKWILV